MRGGSRRKGARDAGTWSPRARVGSPALCPPRQEKGPYLLQGCGQRERCVGVIPCGDVACGRVVGVSALGLGLEQPGPRSCCIPGGF